ncbi:hypothetical protein [Putridiphycobacter roseus]
MDLSLSIEDANSSLHSASNSTAGDKHDTSRAMMHLEIEKKSKQLNEVVQLKKLIPILIDNSQQKSFGVGTVVETNAGSFYMSFNAGKKEIEGQSFTFISLASPLAQAFKNNLNKKEFQFMQKTYTILKTF